MHLRKYILPFLLFLFIFGLYIHNLSISVYGGDAGDFITAAFVGGVPHAPGYPLFTLLGFILTRFHFWPSPAFAVGLISSVSGALGVLFFYLISKQLTKSKLISLISALILAFSYYFWFYSEIAEVFSLNALFVTIILYLSIRIMQSKSFKLLPLLSFVVGLSLTNHQIIVLIFPSILILLFPALKENIKQKRITLKLILSSIVSLLIGFAVYIYVPIASSHNPILNWDTVNSIPSFLHLLLRKDYGTFSAGMFPTPSMQQRFVLARVFSYQVIIQLTIPVIILCFIGAVYLYKKNKYFLGSSLLGFLISGPLFIVYAGFPLTGGFYFGVNERFFIMPIIFLLLFLPFGLLFVSEVFQLRLKRNPFLVQIVFLIIPIMLLYYNFPKTNLSQVMIGDTYAEDMLSSLSPHAILFTAGDTILFNTWYVHYVQGFRSDVQVLNINGNIASPYYSVLQNTYKKKHPNASLLEMMKSLPDILPTDGSVFSVESLATKKDKTLWIPHGLVLQLIAKNQIYSEEQYTKMTDSIWGKMHLPQNQIGNNSLALGSVTISDIPTSYSNAMLLTANFYLTQYKDVKKEKEWILKSLEADPAYDKAYSALGLYYLTEKSCVLAEENFSKAISLNPIETINYLLLYSSYRDCSHNTTAAKNVENLFQKQFHQSFQTYFLNGNKNKK